MEAKQIQTIARDAIKNTREHYGDKVWCFVNTDTRKGLVARAIVVNFGTLASHVAAIHVAAAVAAADAIIDDNDCFT